MADFSCPPAVWVWAGACYWHGVGGIVINSSSSSCQHPPSTVRPLARGPRVLIGWPLPLRFGLDGRMLLARRGRVYG